MEIIDLFYYNFKMSFKILGYFLNENFGADFASKFGNALYFD